MVKYLYINVDSVNQVSRDSFLRQDSLTERVDDREIERQAHVFASFEYLREILDSCPYLVAVLNEQRQIVFFNRALLGLAGTTEERRLLGLRFGEVVNCIHSAETDGGCGSSEFCQACGAFQAMKEGLRGLADARECRLTRTVEGKLEALDLLVSVSPAKVGKELFLVCSVRDISHEKRRETLEQIFFHDILNNAASIEILASTLQQMVQGEASRFAETIRACAASLVEEIHSQQLLLAAENDTLAVCPAELRGGTLIEALVGRLCSSPFASHRVIRIADDSEDVAISCDESILSRVLENMLKNALEASKPGDTVTIGCRDGGQDVEFWVHNAGTIDEYVGLQVFQRSFSTKGIGRGLGTYSMRLLSERYLKGSVTFRSTEAEGTTFIARYPKRWPGRTDWHESS